MHSMLIWFALCRASDKCQREKRKTINGDDLLWAMTTLGFEEYLEPLKLYLAKFREVCAVSMQQLAQPVSGAALGGPSLGQTGAALAGPSPGQTGSVMLGS